MRHFDPQHIPNLRRVFPAVALCLGAIALALICGASVVHAAAQTEPETGDVTNTTAPGAGVVRVLSTLTPTVDAPATLTFALLDVTGALTTTPTSWVPVSGQMLGAPLVDDAAAPMTYTLNLPIKPTGALVDLRVDTGADDSGTDGSGVQIFEAVASPPLLGDGYLQLFEQRSDLRSLARAVDTGRIISGTALIFAEGDAAVFPTDAGADGLFFSADDGLAAIPPGYALATFDAGAVTVTRPITAVMPLHTKPATAPVDFAALPPVDAFDALVEHLLANTDPAADDGVDWAALAARVRPEIEAAAAAVAANGDEAAFLNALADFAQAVGDGLVTVTPADDATPAVAQANAVRQGADQGTLGVDVVELDDGRIVVVYVAPGSQAATAGVKPGMDLRAVDGTPVADALAAVDLSGFPGTDASRRRAQVANLLRAPLDAEVTLDLATPGGAAQRVTLTAGQYPTRRSFGVAGQPMPASYRFLNNVGYLAVADFDRTALLTASVDDFLTQLNARRGEGVVLDLRGNAGGSLAAMLTVAAYFYGPDAPLAAEAVQVQRFDPASGTWQTAPWARGALTGPSAVATFTGPLAVLVDDACGGACELLAALLQSSGRGTIVAQTGTAGIAGEHADVLLPGGIVFTYPRARYAVGAPLADGAIHGAGVAPDVRVPITQESETAKSTGNDPLLAAALDYLTLVQLEPVPVTFDFVGVTSVGPRGWRYDEASRQLRRADGTGLTVIPQQGDDVAAAVAEFVGNFQGEAAELETLTYGERTWTLFGGTLFGQDVRIAGTVEAGDTLLAVLFVTNPAQVEQLTDKVLLPFLENFALDLSVGL
ncbi:MAG: hypothetical protein H6644_02660 [Caldilineaceae bacterium]|nr:hypothetical protein [Caldilineaceae bacterium]